MNAPDGNDPLARLRIPYEEPITEVQRRMAARAGLRANARFFLFCASVLLGALFLASLGYLALWALWYQGGRSYPEMDAHFKHGTIGAELESGMPLRLLRVLPKVFPEHFAPEGDWSHFGLVSESAVDDKGRPLYDIYAGRKVVEARDEPRVSHALPIGFATGWRRGIEVAWFNCAVCHTGVVEVPGAVRPRIVPGMPANTVELERLFLALFDMAVDRRFNLDTFEAAQPANQRLGWLERPLWAWVVLPNTRSKLIERRSQLLALLDPGRATSPVSTDAARCRVELSPKPGCMASFRLADAPSPPAPHRAASALRWGPGRVDTFNPYKMINFGIDADCLPDGERNGASDFPPVFQQGARGNRGMHLHWDGNNASLEERNLSAAIGAGVSEASVDHVSLARIQAWLANLEPPPSPYAAGLDAASVSRGRAIYARQCDDCHGHRDVDGYAYTGARLGQVEPIQYVATDRGRLDSYTPQMEKYQKDRLFCSEPQYRFRHFKKTDGYANQPLDGLWLRAPYLHNGSVPTLYDLLQAPGERPVAFRRGRLHIRLDAEKGGFVAPPCLPSSTGDEPAGSFCFDTRLPGNGNGGHLYGTSLGPDEKRDLLSYLLTF